MNPFNAWPDRLWIGKLITCDACHEERCRARMILSRNGFDEVEAICSKCADVLLDYAKVGGLLISEMAEE